MNNRIEDKLLEDVRELKEKLWKMEMNVSWCCFCCFWLSSAAIGMVIYHIIKYLQGGS